MRIFLVLMIVSYHAYKVILLIVSAREHKRPYLRTTLFSAHLQLGLVVNIIVLWNTIYMEAALDQLHSY